MSPVIEFDQVSKCFLLKPDRARSLQEVFLSIVRRQSGSQVEYIWPLRDVSFSVERGETVSLIGPNGAGKSTALKLVSRIIEPTSGRIKVNGRVGALLELGAGFHPDLTGRDNIYLNGSILGLSRAEIGRKMDEIIAFAELERFIDVPVKHYSSGMYVRLGFSVAVHTDPEILLIDEVLAVGDQSFQAKCLQRIAQMQERGVTILFVSHSLDMVRRLCQRAIWLGEGHVQAIGSANKVILSYLTEVWKERNIQLLAEGDAVGRGRRFGSGQIAITNVEIRDEAECLRSVFQTGDKFLVRMHYQVHQPVRRPAFGVAIYRQDGVLITSPNMIYSGYEIDVICGEGTVDYVIESLPLLPGCYELTAAVYDDHVTDPYDHLHRAWTFEVQAGNTLERDGLVSVPCHWEHRGS